MSDSRQESVVRSADFQLEPKPWGELRWGVSGELGNSAELTVGWCVLAAGEANGLHYHPNCEEVLVVVDGQIVHSFDGEEILMHEGDLIVLPSGVVHNARNVGSEPARLLICFSSAERTAVSVQGGQAT